LWDVLELGSCS